MLIQWYILFFSLHLFAFKVIFSQGTLLGWNANHHKNNLHHLFYHRKNFQITKIKNHEVFYNEKKQWYFLYFSLQLSAVKVTFSQGILPVRNSNYCRNNLQQLFYPRKNFQNITIKNNGAESPPGLTVYYL